MPPPPHQELAALCSECEMSGAELRAVLEALALTVEPVPPAPGGRAALLARLEGERGRRRAGRGALRLTAIALLWVAQPGASVARAEIPVAPAAEIERHELARGEIVEWCGGFAFEGAAWSASAKLALRRERIDAGQSDERGVELSVARRIGSRLSLDATTRFDPAFGARPAGVALELSYAFEF
jgi:hypothetical protein